MLHILCVYAYSWHSYVDQASTDFNILDLSITLLYVLFFLLTTRLTMLILALTLFSVVTALPQPLPLPNPTDVLPTLTLVNFGEWPVSGSILQPRLTPAKSTKKITGTRTKVDDTSGGGGVVTKVVNKTVTTTGKYRGTSKGK